MENLDGLALALLGVKGHRAGHADGDRLGWRTALHGTQAIVQGNGILQGCQGRGGVKGDEWLVPGRTQSIDELSHTARRKIRRGHAVQMATEQPPPGVSQRQHRPR